MLFTQKAAKNSGYPSIKYTLNVAIFFAGYCMKQFFYKFLNDCKVVVYGNCCFILVENPWLNSNYFTISTKNSKKYLCITILKAGWLPPGVWVENRLFQNILEQFNPIMLSQKIELSQIHMGNLPIPFYRLKKGLKKSQQF